MLTFCKSLINFIFVRGLAVHDTEVGLTSALIFKPKVSISELEYPAEEIKRKSLTAKRGSGKREAGIRGPKSGKSVGLLMFIES